MMMRDPANCLITIQTCMIWSKTIKDPLTNICKYSSDCIATVNGGQVVVCGLADGHVHGSLINGIPIFDL